MVPNGKIKQSPGCNQQPIINSGPVPFCFIDLFYGILPLASCNQVHFFIDDWKKDRVDGSQSCLYGDHPLVIWKDFIDCHVHFYLCSTPNIVWLGSFGITETWIQAF